MTPEEGIDQLTEEIYREFCESSGMNNCPLQNAWNAVEDKYGSIESGGLIDGLFTETIRYTVGFMVSNIANAISLEESQKSKDSEEKTVDSPEWDTYIPEDEPPLNFSDETCPHCLCEQVVWDESDEAMRCELCGSIF